MTRQETPVRTANHSHAFGIQRQVILQRSKYSRLEEDSASHVMDNHHNSRLVVVLYPGAAIPARLSHPGFQSDQSGTKCCFGQSPWIPGSSLNKKMKQTSASNLKMYESEIKNRRHTDVSPISTARPSLFRPAVKLLHSAGN